MGCRGVTVLALVIRLLSSCRRTSRVWLKNPKDQNQAGSHGPDAEKMEKVRQATRRRVSTRYGVSGRLAPRPGRFYIGLVWPLGERWQGFEPCMAGNYSVTLSLYWLIRLLIQVVDLNHNASLKSISVYTFRHNAQLLASKLGFRGRPK